MKTPLIQNVLVASVSTMYNTKYFVTVPKNRIFLCPIFVKDYLNLSYIVNPLDYNDIESIEIFPTQSYQNFPELDVGKYNFLGVARYSYSNYKNPNHVLFGTSLSVVDIRQACDTEMLIQDWYIFEITKN